MRLFGAFSRTATFMPADAASRTAEQPAMPEPMTTTTYRSLASGWAVRQH